MKSETLQLKRYTFFLLLLFISTAWSTTARAEVTFNCGAAKVWTDKVDYIPGEVAIISGSGWQPGETVDLILFSTNLNVFEHFEVVADNEGNFTGLTYDILEIHWGERFVLDAIGITSGCTAVWHFTDGNSITFNNAPQTGTVFTGVGGTVTYAFSISRDGAGNTFTTTLGTTGLPTGVTAVFSPSSLTFAPGATLSSTLTLTVASTVPAGVHNFTVTGSGGGSRAMTLTVSGCVAPSITTQPINQTITYGSNASFSVTAAGTAPLTYQWQVNTGSGFVNISGANASTFSISQPTVAMSGHQYRVAVTGACGTLTSSAVSLTVSPRTINVVAENKSKVYGSTDPALTYQFTPALIGTDAFTGALSRVAGENVGTYAINQGTLALSGNYTLNFTGAQLTISQLAVTVTADAKTKTFGDVDPALTFVSVPAVGATLANNEVIGFTGSLTRAAGENVGSYAILQGSVANSNYTITYTGANLAIGQLAVAVTADAKTKTFGDVDPALTFVSVPAVGSTLANNEVIAFTGALSRAVGEDVGTYAIGRNTLANSNYTITYTGADLTITPLAVTVTADAKGKTYGQVDPALTFISNPTVGTILANNEVIAFTGALSRAVGEDVGTYAIGQNTLANSNYNISYTGALLTINQLAVTVTADAKGKTYGQVDPALTFVSVPAVGSTLANNEVVAFTGSLTRNSGENVGIYAILQGSVANANYSITYTGADLTIGQLAVTVTADAKSKTYGQVDPALTFVSVPAVGSTLANGLTIGFIGSLSRAIGENVGTYAIGRNTLANSNYTIAYTGANLTITPLAVTVTAEAKSKTYGQVDPPLTFVSSPAVGSTLANGLTIGFTGSLTRAIGENVGTYAIGRNTLANSNYTIAYTSANLTITPLAVTVTADAKSKFCGQVDPALTFVSNPAVGFVLANGEIIRFTGALSRMIGEGVGFYNILRGSLANSNYAITYVGAQLEIRAVSIDASASSTPVPVGSSATLRAVISPAVAGVSVTFTLTNDANSVIFNTTLITDALGRVTATVPSSSLVLGVYMVTATAGSGCASSIAYIPVFDASGNFVTGGGWIDSPSGALVGTTITGKANFGFVSRYRRGSNQVDGNTTFHFNAGNVSFKSTFHESGSLVISGRRATYRGSGTVNDVPGFRFTLVAIDGHLNNGTGPDRFRIRITNGSGVVVYDNGLNAAENTDVSTVLGGGSIVIHEMRQKGSGMEGQTSDGAQISVNAFPNPFSEKVVFDMQFAKEGNAQLEIFDIRGTKVGTLFSQRVEAGLQYRVEYTPTNLLPGMLVYRLILDGEVITGRILYQK